MGVFQRPDSTKWWLLLEGDTKRGRKTTREKTPFLVDAPTAEMRKENKANAEALYHKRMHDVNRVSSGLAPKPQATMTFSAYGAWYDTHIIAFHKGKVRERDILAGLTARFGPRDLTDITKDDVIEWRSERATATSTGNALREYALLRRMLNVAVGDYLTASPLTKMPKMKPDAFEAAVLEKDEELRLFAALAPPDRAFVLCALDTIMRQADVRNLTRAQDRGTYIKVVNPKTGKPYKVPVSARLRAALDAIPKDGGPYYFPHRRGHEDVRTTHRVISRMLERACERADIVYGRKKGGITFHSLRHTGASRASDSGVNTRTLMEMGGWSSLQQLQRYVHVTEAAKVAAVNAIAPLMLVPPAGNTDPFAWATLAVEASGKPVVAGLSRKTKTVRKAG